MKKTTATERSKDLRLKVQHVRLLRAKDLDEAVGGAPTTGTANCVSNATC